MAFVRWYDGVTQRWYISSAYGVRPVGLDIGSGGGLSSPGDSLFQTLRERVPLPDIRIGRYGSTTFTGIADWPYSDIGKDKLRYVEAVPLLSTRMPSGSNQHRNIHIQYGKFWKYLRVEIEGTSGLYFRGSVTNDSYHDEYSVIQYIPVAAPNDSAATLAFPHRIVCDDWPHEDFKVTIPRNDVVYEDIVPQSVIAARAISFSGAVTGNGPMQIQIPVTAPLVDTSLHLWDGGAYLEHVADYIANPMVVSGLSATGTSGGLRAAAVMSSLAAYNAATDLTGTNAYMFHDPGSGILYYKYNMGTQGTDHLDLLYAAPQYALYAESDTTVPELGVCSLMDCQNYFGYKYYLYDGNYVGNHPGEYSPWTAFPSSTYFTDVVD
jgi:hypothetical protein